jgi:DNA-binding CsgD family transcriptional regulator
MRIAQSVQLTKDEKEILTIWARGRRIPARQMQRAKIVLLAAEGHQNKTIAAQLNISRRTVQLWRQRFLALRLPGLEKDASVWALNPGMGKTYVSKIRRLWNSLSAKNNCIATYPP